MTVPGVRLHIDDRGSGPAIVFLHGFAGSARNFGPQIRALQGDHRVVTFDARGHARSEAPVDPQAYTMDALVTDVEAVVASLGEERVTLCGLSMGAAVALRYAMRHLERLRGLVLAAFPSGRRAGDDGWATQFADLIERDGLEEAGSRFVWGGGRFDERSAALIRQGYLEHQPHALVAILRGVLATLPSIAELEHELRSVDVPTIVIVGEKDFSSLESSRALARALPRADLREIADAGHVVNLQKAESFNAVLREFLCRIEVRADA